MKEIIKGVLLTLLIAAIAVGCSELKGMVTKERTGCSHSHEKQVTVNKWQSLGKPAGGAFKSYMDYRMITDTLSSQFALQQRCRTDMHGVRTLNGLWVVAVSPRYGEIGDVIRLSLSTGERHEVVIGDFKADAHTGGGTYTLHDGSVVEVIVDTPMLCSGCKSSGDMSHHLGAGKVIEIERLNDAY